MSSCGLGIEVSFVGHVECIQYARYVERGVSAYQTNLALWNTVKQTSPFVLTILQEFIDCPSVRNGSPLANQTFHWGKWSFSPNESLLSTSSPCAGACYVCFLTSDPDAIRLKEFYDVMSFHVLFIYIIWIWAIQIVFRYIRSLTVSLFSVRSTTLQTWCTAWLAQ